MNAIEIARERWLAERPKHVQFASEMESRLQGLVKEAGVSAEVHARAKEVHSLVKKLLAKPHLSYETLSDKTGARIVVRYLSETQEVLSLLESRFGIRKVEDTAARLKIDKVGYQSVHIDGLTFLETDDLHSHFPSSEFFVELQLRTMAQHLWSEISHDTFYKNDVLIQQLPLDLQRRVHLMAGQVEVADREFDRMNAEVPIDPASQVFRSLEKIYYGLTAQRPNVELSLEAIRLLLPLYPADGSAEGVSHHIEERFHNSENMFRDVYANPDNIHGQSAFFFQPEAVMIYDCLVTDRDQTLKAWNEKFPTEELDRVATLFGISLE